ncbi:hypothetical protein AKJ09_03658 [Labilithrix luteola]|uniref:Uncharacterized protein n=1 Tax=Labilithrix luteola TaxID=1391654 RepID=A0A0K1PV32_9BACT|nr:hypothetical protein [Labilithrix luteola]AKU96994.1 hypothetical protein AKJ09_03658 [Labilithrix luteola]
MRVITNITIDLKFNVDVTAPQFHVQFTDVDGNGLETHGTTTIADDAAFALWREFPGLLDAAKKAVEVKAAEVAEPGALAERIAAANEAERRQREAAAALADVESELASKRAELESLAQR